MEKKRSAQPILNNDQQESSAKDLDSQNSSTHHMPAANKNAGSKSNGNADNKGNKGRSK